MSGSNGAKTDLRQQHATDATSLSDQCKVHGDWKKNKQKNQNKAKEAIVLSTVIATNCTSSYKSYRMFSFTFTEMTVIDYIKTIFISTGTRIWHS